MSMFHPIDVSATALTAEKTRIDVISENMANANTTRAAGGMPYRRQMVVFEEKRPNSFSDYLDRASNHFNDGVSVREIAKDSTPFKLVYEPGHPDADEGGYVRKPNVDVTKEMVDMIDAYRAYEANVTSMNATKSMMMKALDIGRR